MSLSRYAGKVAVITASTQGIGLSIAERLAAEGASVVVSSRKAENVARAVEELRSKNYKVEGVVCHVANAEDRKRLFQTALQKYGGIDVLISNAAVNPAFGEVTTLKTDEKSWDKIFEVNVKATWLLAKEGAPLLRQRKGSNMLFTSSAVGFQVIRGAKIGAYAVSKTAILGLTKSIADELAPDIRVNCVAPGVIKTKFSEVVSDNEEVLQDIYSQMSLKRMGRPEEVSSLVAYLCSDEASFITGENICISGGLLSRI